MESPNREGSIVKHDEMLDQPASRPMIPVLGERLKRALEQYLVVTPNTSIDRGAADLEPSMLTTPGLAVLPVSSVDGLDHAVEQLLDYLWQPHSGTGIILLPYEISRSVFAEFAKPLIKFGVTIETSPGPDCREYARSVLREFSERRSVSDSREGPDTIQLLDSWRKHLDNGDELRAEGDSQSALLEYEESLTLAETQTSYDQADTAWQRNLSVSYRRIARALADLDDRQSALEAFRNSLSIAERLVEDDPSKGNEWHRELWSMQIEIGDLLHALADKVGALAAYRQSIGLTRRFAERDPDWRYCLAFSNERVGDILFGTGDKAGALNAYRTSLEIVRALVAENRNETEWQRILFRISTSIGSVLSAQGDTWGALNAYRDGFKIAEPLAVRDPTNAQWQTDLIVACANLGTQNVVLSPKLRREYLRRGREILLALESTDLSIPKHDWLVWFDHHLARL